MPYGVLTGDTLFIGDVGRPDLLASLGFTRDELAGDLYDSLHKKLLTLPDVTRCTRPTAQDRRAARSSPPNSRRRSATSGDQLRAARDRQGRVRRARDRGPATGARLLRVRRILNRKEHALLDETKRRRRWSTTT